MNLLLFSGSPRPGSAVSQLLLAAAALAPVETTVTNFEGVLTMPLFNPILDGQGVAPATQVAALRQLVQQADAVLLATPEYAYGMPGSLKNALDWLVSAGSFYGKPTGVLSGSPSAEGGEKARNSLLLTLEALGAAVVPAASFAVPMVRARFGADGVVTDTALMDQLREAVQALLLAATKDNRP